MTIEFPLVPKALAVKIIFPREFVAAAPVLFDDPFGVV